MSKRRLLILVPYPYGLGPSQRFRIELYLDRMEEKGLAYEYHSFLDEEGYSSLYKQGSWLNKAMAFLRGYFRRWVLMFRIRGFDTVLIQREASPIGPAIFEFIISRIFKKKLIYDIDDAIWLPNYAEANARFHFLKYYKKIDHIMAMADRIIAGNDFLANRAVQFNEDVRIIPTVVDTNGHHNSKLYSHSERSKDSIVTLGWTGTHSTNRHIEYLSPVFEDLKKTYDFRLLVISNSQPDLSDAFMEYRKWNRDTEISDLLEMDIGLMPLIPDNEFAEGKCGFKAIQYMALEIPVIISPLGVNSQIVQHESNGLLGGELDEWKIYLERFFLNPESFKEMGLKGRKSIVENYSVSAHKDNFLEAIIH